MTATQPPIAQLVPHAGTMCLLEELDDWNDEHVIARTRSHLSRSNPLARDGRLHAIHLCEYGAQAMALHGGLLAHRDGGGPVPGFLVALRDVHLARFDAGESPSPLIVEARRLHGDATGWQYDFTVTREGARLASGRATIVLRRTP